MQYASSSLLNYLQPIVNEINNAYSNNMITQETAQCYLLRFLKVQIDWFFDDKYHEVVQLIARDLSFDHDTTMPFQRILYHTVKDIYSRLIMSTTGITNYDDLILISLMINAMIQTTGEHKAFTLSVLNLEDSEEGTSVLKERFINLLFIQVKAILLSFRQSYSCNE